MQKYIAIIEGTSVNIFRDGVWSTTGRLDSVCLERKEAHIIDADAPLGEEVYAALDDALTEAMAGGKTEAEIEL